MNFINLTDKDTVLVEVLDSKGKVLTARKSSDKPFGSLSWSTTGVSYFDGVYNVSLPADFAPYTRVTLNDKVVYDTTAKA